MIEIKKTCDVCLLPMGEYTSTVGKYLDRDEIRRVECAGVQFLDFDMCIPCYEGAKEVIKKYGNRMR